jgi:hypothetical protein
MLVTRNSRSHAKMSASCSASSFADTLRHIVSGLCNGDAFSARLGDDADDRTRRTDSEHQRADLDDSDSGRPDGIADILRETAHLRWTEKGQSGLVAVGDLERLGRCIAISEIIVGGRSQTVDSKAERCPSGRSSTLGNQLRSRVLTHTETFQHTSRSTTSALKRSGTAVSFRAKTSTTAREPCTRTGLDVGVARGCVRFALQPSLSEAITFAVLPHPPTPAVPWPKWIFFFLTGLTFSTMEYFTDSILPGLAVHAVSLLTFFALVWPYDAGRPLVYGAGATAWLWVHLAQAAFFSIIACWAFRHLSQAGGIAAASQLSSREANVKFSARRRRRSTS